MAGGHYCRLEKNGEPMVPDAELLETLRAGVRKTIESDIPFHRHERLTKDVIEIYRKQELNAKVTLLETLHELYTTYYTLGGIADGFYGPLAPSTGFISDFDIRGYKEGFLLFSESPEKVEIKLRKNPPQEKMYEAFTDQLLFNKVIHVKNVGELNLTLQ